MNDVPFWLPGVATVALTLVAGAFLLPIAIFLYRLNHWLFTWPLPAWERAERRDVFEVQLQAFLAEERRQGYQPPSSGLRLVVRMLTTLPVDIWDSSQAVVGRCATALQLVRPLLDGRQPNATTQSMRRLLILLDGVLRRLFPRLFRRRVDAVVPSGTPFEVIATPPQPALSAADEDALFRMRITQGNNVMMETANQVIRQNAVHRERAYRIAIDSMTWQNPSIALLHSQQNQRPPTAMAQYGQARTARISSPPSRQAQPEMN